MKKFIFTVLIILCSACYVHASSYLLDWKAIGNATGYKIKMSLDYMKTWDAGKDVGNVASYLYEGLPDEGVVHFMVIPYDKDGDVNNTEFGMWYKPKPKIIHVGGGKSE